MHYTPGLAIPGGVDQGTLTPNAFLNAFGIRTKISGDVHGYLCADFNVASGDGAHRLWRRVLRR
jgi:hypothetical protein